MNVTPWHQDYNLLLNVKSNELVVNFGTKQRWNYNPFTIKEVTEHLTWVLHADSVVRKARQTPLGV